MLQKIRNPYFMKWGLWAILIVTIPSFVLFYGFGGQPAPEQIVTGPLVKVSHAGEHVELDRFDLQNVQNTATNYYGGLAAMGGMQADQRWIRSSLTPREIATFAVGEVALQLRAEDEKIRVSNEQVQQYLKNRGFTNESFAAEVRRYGGTEAQYLRWMRDQISSDAVKRSVQRVARPSLLELWEEYKLSNEGLTVSWANVPVEVSPDGEISEEEIRAEYDKLVAAEDNMVKNPERRIYEYVALPVPFAPPAQPTDEDLLAEYETLEGEEYQTEGGYRVRHVLVSHARNADAAALAAARAEATEARARINGGEDFAAVANEITDDIRNFEFVNDYTSPTMRGGLLPGYIAGTERAIWGDEYMNFVTTIGPGEVSPVLHTPQGFVVAEVVESTPPGKKPFDEVRDMLRQRATQRLSTEAADARKASIEANREKLRDARARYDAMEDVAKAVGGTVGVTSPTLATGANIPPAGFFNNDATAIRNLLPGIKSDVFEATNGTVAVLRVREVLPPAIMELDEALRTRIQSRVRRMKAVEAARAEATRLQALVSDSDNITTVGLANSLSAQTSEFTRSAIPEEFRFIMGAAQKFARAKSGEIFTLEAGFDPNFTAVYIVQVNAVEEPAKRDFIENMQDLERGVLFAKQQGYIEDFRRDAVERLDAWFNPEYVVEDERASR